MRPLLLRCSLAFALPLLLLGRSVSETSAPIVVPEGQVIEVRLLQQVSSHTATAGDPIKMETLAGLVMNDRIVVRKGAPLTAILSAVSKKARRGPGGRISLQITGVDMADGSKLPLSTTQASSGGGPGKKLYKGILITSIVLISPAGLATSLLLHGEDIVLPEGTALEAHVAAATTLDPEKFEADHRTDGPTASASPVPASSTGQVALHVETSAGDGSLWVDGKFQGETPATVQIKPGLRTLTVNRKGYRTWKEKVIIAGSALSLTITLDKK